MGEKLAALKKVVLPEEGIRALYGPYDENIKYLESLISVRLHLRGNELMIEGDDSDVEVVLSILEDFAPCSRKAGGCPTMS
jgi:phosphate starvation-inducible PhoH-like protein